MRYRRRYVYGPGVSPDEDDCYDEDDELEDEDRDDDDVEEPADEPDDYDDPSHDYINEGPADQDCP